ncbi:MAG: DNA polymerase I [Alphaproteobacteria bacterium]
MLKGRLLLTAALNKSSCMKAFFPVISSTSSSSVYLIDGSGFIFRAFHALPPLARPDGTQVGAVLGFCNILLKLLQDHQPQRLAVIFDAGRKTFRHAIYPDYKANRPPPPPELIPQFALIREACHAFHIPLVELENYEADDILATYANQALEQRCDVTIVSSDKDLMQLIGPHVRLYDPLKNRAIEEAQVIEKFGVPPAQVVDVQALIGDKSDHVPGVPGIGVKTAAELIQRFGTLENLYQHLEEIPQPRRRKMLEENKAQAFISKQLVTLKQDLSLGASLDDFARRPFDQGSVQAFLKENHFFTLSSRLEKQGAFSKPEAAPSQSLQTDAYSLIQDPQTLAGWLGQAKKQGYVVIDVETTSLHAMEAKLVGIAIGLSPGQAAYIPLTHQTEVPQISPEIALDMLRPVLTDPSIRKISHNLKYDLLVLANAGIEAVSPVEDTLLMSYVLDAGLHSHSLDFLAQHHLNHTTISFKDVAGVGREQRTFDHVPLDVACAYAAEDADVTLRLYHLFRQRLQQAHLQTLYQTLEKPLIPVVVAMEKAGILVDVVRLEKLSESFGERLKVLEEEIYTLTGETFNIASPKQLGEILFEKLHFPGGKKGKSGAYSTSADVLEVFADQGHLLPTRLLEWRQLAKLKNTYTDALLTQINPQTGRIHTSYVMAGTSTGRLASTDPNLQNIPIRTPEGKAIRQAFIPQPGYRLVSLDYSQIELRLLAHLGNVASLQEAFRNHVDIHAQTASQVFGVPLERVDAGLRRKAKAINFGILYGLSPFGLAKQLGIPQRDAAAHIQAYFQHYPGIQHYLEETKDFARSQGYVTTLLGRRCYVPEIQDRNPVRRNGAERQAINAPLQGSSADIIKRAMVALFQYLHAEKSEARLLLQVHDELLLEIPEGEVSLRVPALQALMSNVVKLCVPLEVGVGVGFNWDDAHP